MTEQRAYGRGMLAACLAAAALAWGLTGCGKAPQENKAAPLRLALVRAADGWPDSATDGLALAQKRLGAQVQQMLHSTPNGYFSDLNLYATEDSDIVIADGAEFAAATSRVARGFPKKHFALIDAGLPEPNVSSIVFREQEGGFLAGALAALVSKTRRVAFLGGIEGPVTGRYEAGFAAGVRQIDPSVKVRVAYSGSFIDPVPARAAAAKLYGAGADVLFLAAGPASLGALSETSARPKVYAIGAGDDLDVQARGKVLASVLKRANLAVFQLALAATSQKYPAGVTSLGLREGGIALTAFRYSRGVVSGEMLAKLDRLQTDILAGRIVPPPTGAALAAWKPTKQ